MDTVAVHAGLWKSDTVTAHSLHARTGSMLTQARSSGSACRHNTVLRKRIHPAEAEKERRWQSLEEVGLEARDVDGVGQRDADEMLEQMEMDDEMGAY